MLHQPLHGLDSLCQIEITTKGRVSTDNVTAIRIFVVMDIFCS